MTMLKWGEESTRRPESGVDRGVLYANQFRGVVWNGLVSVEDTFVGGEITSYHFDGIKYADVAAPKNFQATINALTYPREFAACAGDRPVIPGFVLTRQVRSPFGLSYRTKVGSGYKVHVVYNAIATPTTRGYTTLNDSPEPSRFAWLIDATPPSSKNYRPTAHFVLDSTKMSANAIRSIESVLYGDTNNDARLPSVDELISRVSQWDPHVVGAISDGLAPLTPGMGDLSPSTIPGVYHVLSTAKLVKTAVRGLYRKD